MAYAPDGLTPLRLRQDVSLTAFAIFIQYCEHVDSDFGVTFVSTKSTAKLFQMRHDNFKSYDTELQEKGWIVKHDSAIKGREVRQVFAGWEPLILRGKNLTEKEAGPFYEQFIFSDTNVLKFRKLAANLGFIDLEFLKFREVLLNFRIGFLNFREKFLNFRKTYKEYNHSFEPSLLTISENQEEEGASAPPPPPNFKKIEEEKPAISASAANADEPTNAANLNEPHDTVAAVADGAVQGNVQTFAGIVVNPESPSLADVRPDIPDDLDYLVYLKTKAENARLDVVVTYRNMLRWCEKNHKPPNRFRLLRWLDKDRDDLPMTYQPSEVTTETGGAAANNNPTDCLRCMGTGLEEVFSMTGEPLGRRNNCKHAPLIKGEWLWQRQNPGIEWRDLDEEIYEQKAV